MSGGWEVPAGTLNVHITVCIWDLPRARAKRCVYGRLQRPVNAGPRCPPSLGSHPSAGGLRVSLISRVVLRVPIFEAQRTDGRNLSNVLTGLCPVKVPGIAR